jgi:hypothetical protein
VCPLGKDFPHSRQPRAFQNQEGARAFHDGFHQLHGQPERENAQQQLQGHFTLPGEVQGNRQQKTKQPVAHLGGDPHQAIQPQGMVAAQVEHGEHPHVQALASRPEQGEGYQGKDQQERYQRALAQQAGQHAPAGFWLQRGQEIDQHQRQNNQQDKAPVVAPKAKQPAKYGARQPPGNAETHLLFGKVTRLAR